MSNDRIAPETIAALLDGTLSAEERARVLAALARGDESYEDLLEASALVRALEDEGGRGEPGEPLPHPRPGVGSGAGPAARRWRRGLLTAVPLLAAAGIAAIVLPARFGRTGAPDIAQVVGDATVPGQTGDMASRFGTGWEQPGWSVVRGADDPLSRDGGAFRLGGRFAQLDLSLRARDAAAVRAAAAALGRLAARVDGGAPVAAQVEALATSPIAEADASLPAVASALRDLAASPAWFDLGAWSEAARLAARAGRAEFFAPARPPMQALTRILTALDRAPDDERRAGAAAVARFRALRNRAVGAPADLATLRALLDSAIAAVDR
ncbi:hypothetical protein [Roseisolibacter agri]|uniref:Anti-sigma factor n=1 Tax=Roseisolibacter agri TaxID=2014610 RepID=A0AA37V8I1_9BACT|nr:hypothetical protein [Roseisolibacter agri]GLC27806.1 hypothetical protein rosag_43190 [Roseisolibacter agri]